MPDHMPETESAPDRRKATWQFLIALGIVLGGVTLGTWVILPKMDGPGRSQERFGRSRVETPERSAATPAPASAAPKRAPLILDGNLVWIAGGTFAMGAANGAPDERPVHSVTVNGFWISRYEVTNDEFAEFVKATGYVTTAERKPDPKDFPGVPEENLVAGALVFTPPPGNVPLDNAAAWWRYVPGASWRHPEGPQSDLQGRGNHPVVHVSWFDAVAYAKWLSTSTGIEHRLPTEAEWEFAARGGLDGKEFVWGDEFQPGDKSMGNIWQGNFPAENSAADGFRGTAPVGSFPANGYGLHDMAGNVWEWCADWYRPDYYAQSPAQNPPGPESGLDPAEPGVPKRVQRGGSFLCTDVYCGAYRPGRRMKTSPDTGLSHAGFRLVRVGPRPQ
jgi:formylglycine-generating enzyme required for sulfatase activity